MGSTDAVINRILAGHPEWSANWLDAEKPQHTVYLDAYWVDQTEVTTAQYAKCVAAGACSAPAFLTSATRAEYYGNPQYANFPVVAVNWHQATAYCAWAGRGLISEVQWEKAARGTDARMYPWGNAAPDSGLLNFNANIGDTTEVGSYPGGASPYGAMDMAGNVWEWTADWVGTYPFGEVSNPPGPVSGEGLVLRGGSWLIIADYVRSAYRGWSYAEGFDFDSGFRCSRSLP